jgi:hypothetical protein
MTQYSGKVIRKTPVTPTQQSASGVWKLNEQAAAIRNNSWPVPGVPDPISRSVRLRSSASAYLSRTLGTPTDGKKWTYSVWVKRGILTAGTGTAQQLLSAGSATAFFRFSTTDTLVSGWTGAANLETTQVFRDPSAWYHIMLVVDTTQATASNRVKYYVNGTQITAFATTDYPTQNSTTTINSAVAHNIGAYTSSTQYLDGYLTEINFIDGQALTPSSFGTTDTATGAWIPMPYTGTYGTNGFYLNFKDNTSTTTLGYDYSGNANNWTANNISLTAGSTYDSMLDVPTPWVGYTTTTDTSAVTRGNYAVMNPLDAQGTATLSDGNLTLASATTAHKNRKATFLLPSTGKWYWELTTASTCSSTVILGWGLQTTSAASDSQAGNANTWMAQNDANQDIFNQTTSVLSTGSAVAGGSIRQVAYDADTGKLWFGVNNSWYSSTDLTSGNPSAGTNQCMTLSAGDYFPAITCYNLTANANFGQRPFSYSPPSGYKSLVTTNLSTPTIANGASYMAATLYTGNGATGQSVVNSGNNTAAISFKPDFVWVKVRSTAGTDHYLADSVRGATKYLQSDTTAAEGTNNGITAFNSNGFSVGAIGDTNTNGATIVGWQWQAGAGSSSSNTSGSITSTVSVSTTSGFSVVSFNSGTAGNKTVGHGLGVTPSFIITKNRDGVASWAVWSSSFSNTAQGYLLLNGTGAVTNDSRQWANTAPTSTVFSFESGYTFTASNNIIAYCFAAVAGYSAFGKYTGNNSSDGPFVYTGFRPRWILFKDSTNAATNWVLQDTSRFTYNVATGGLLANTSASEYSTGYDVDILSNGFKIRRSGGDTNQSGATIIYAAFAENPFKYSNAR